MAKAVPSAGFTLIELMIALTVVAITTSFAVAAYRGHVQRGHRLEAAQALLAAAAEEEKFHLAHGRYTGILDDFTGGEPAGLPIASATPRGRYRLQIEAADALQFRIVASPAAGHDDPSCEQLSIDESGRRRALDRSGRDSTARCW